MNSEKLSRRLETVASFIHKGMKIADIGSDHAYLPCYAIKTGRASFAVAGEVVEGPFYSARKQVAKEDLTGFIDVRKGNGLEVIRRGEVDCIIIAGMGGALITDILEAGIDKLTGSERLILQPNIAAQNVRKWLLENDWQLTNERIIKEDGKFYEIIVSEKKSGAMPYKELQKELLLGPFLLKESSEIFKEKWTLELRQWENILTELDRAENNIKTKEKRKELIEKIQIVREVLT